MKIRPLIISLFTLTLLSCETFLELELPDTTPSLVINALLETSSPVKVLISESNSILEDRNFPNVTDAIVTISDNQGNSYPLTYLSNDNWNGATGWYTNEALNPLPGVTYTIDAFKAGLGTATGTAMIPAMPQVKSITHIGLSPENHYGEYLYADFRLVFINPPGDNYYEIDFYYDGEKETMGPDGTQNTIRYTQYAYVGSRNPNYNQGYRIGTALLFNDLLLDPEEASMDFQVYIPYEVPLEIKAILRVLTKESYDYILASNLQRENRGDPLSQPVQVPTNITNGFGIFKAQSSASIGGTLYLTRE